MGLSRLFNSRSRYRYKFSIVVVCYDMEREIERTLQSLSAQYQQAVEVEAYEVIVVDNGSPNPLPESQVTRFGAHFRLLRIDDASPAPGIAINAAVAQCEGEYIGIIIDGARMLSPGVLRGASEAFARSDDAVVATLGFHLGPEHQSLSSLQGYDQQVEDRLLGQIDWLADGYRLFEIASVSGSARFGWYGPIAECNCMFMKRSRYRAIGGYDPAFRASGGGLSNHDIYKRACEYQSASLYYLLGEGCFHQIHGGVTTGGGQSQPQKFVQLQEEYFGIRGENYAAPTNPPILLGEIPLAASWLSPQEDEASVQTPLRSENVIEHLQTVGLAYQLQE